MQRQYHRMQLKDFGSRTQLKNKLVYVPGALVLAYGIWLVLVA